MSNAPAFDHSAYKSPVDFQTSGVDYRFALPTHPAWVGYVLWIVGFTGAHRFYFGRPLTGILWFVTGGLFLIGWIVDLFLIQGMADSVDGRYPSGRIDYGVAWLLHIFLGLFGIHRFYMGKIVTGVIYLCTGGLFGIGYIYDTLTLNDQIAELNHFDL
jgi:TM2 domain-containing membrane protein YozV